MSDATGASRALTRLSRRQSTIHPLLPSRPRAAREIAALVDDGDLEPLLDERRYRFSEVGEAHHRLEAGEGVGTVVLENDP